MVLHYASELKTLLHNLIVNHISCHVYTLFDLIYKCIYREF